jgi:SagB-type dehydrogenase family enzyme
VAVTWREYHEATKHTVESLRRAPHVLDWANMPDPFRHYEGTPVVDLPADPSAPEMPALEVLGGGSGFTPAREGASLLSQLLFYSAAISASKRVSSTGYRYALRVNPSSGNLHPTEFHFRARGVKEWPDGLYHYIPSMHMAEQRALGDIEMKSGGSSAPLVFGLTSITWREAWKYGDRGYRYCLHDIGHAWQALVLAARAIGCDSFATGDFPDDEVTQRCRLSDDEAPMLLVELGGASIPARESNAGETVWYGGQANQLSAEEVSSEWINRIHDATKLSSVTQRGTVISEPVPTGCSEIKLPHPATSRRTFGETARRRRSALDFVGGSQSISLAQLSAILGAASQRLIADFVRKSFVKLYLYVHRVEGLKPGVYRYWSASAELELIKLGDQRVVAAELCLGQKLAGNACVAFSMVGDLERAVHAHGDRGYRYVHFEAGAIGHRIYLAAEALGLGATGIGAFYDVEVHRYLKLAPQQQVVYHFAIGYPVPDVRVRG